MKIHELKVDPTYFSALWAGLKRFELRRNDRDFAIGDVLWLREYSAAEGYSGRSMKMEVTFMLNCEPWLQPDFVAMSLIPIEQRAIGAGRP